MAILRGEDAPKLVVVVPVMRVVMVMTWRWIMIITVRKVVKLVFVLLTMFEHPSG